MIGCPGEGMQRQVVGKKIKVGVMTCSTLIVTQTAVLCLHSGNTHSSSGRSSLCTALFVLFVCSGALNSLTSQWTMTHPSSNKRCLNSLIPAPLCHSPALLPPYALPSLLVSFLFPPFLFTLLLFFNPPFASTAHYW